MRIMCIKNMSEPIHLIFLFVTCTVHRRSEVRKNRHEAEKVAIDTMNGICIEWKNRIYIYNFP